MHDLYDVISDDVYFWGLKIIFQIIVRLIVLTIPDLPEPTELSSIWYWFKYKEFH